MTAIANFTTESPASALNYIGEDHQVKKYISITQDNWFTLSYDINTYRSNHSRILVPSEVRKDDNKGIERHIRQARAREDKSRHPVVAEIDREALGGADRGERLVDLVGLDVCHHLASHRVLISRRCLENCGTSGNQIGTGVRARDSGPRWGERRWSA